MLPGPLLRLTRPGQRRCNSLSWPRSPTAWDLLFILARKSFGGWWVGGLGEGAAVSLRQKDAGQHFICNHSNVLAVLEFRTLVGGTWEVG